MHHIAHRYGTGTARTQRNMSERLGFTIIELLIVIVVLAVLAIIAFVAYQGIQDRAYNTRIIAMVRQYYNAIEQYKSIKEEYPKTGPEDGGHRIATVCLGTGYVDNYCGLITEVPTYEDEVFNQRIATVLDGVPKVNDQLLPAGPEEFVGAVYGDDHIWSMKGYHTYARTIQYALHGTNASCQLPGAWAYRVTTEPRPTTACIIELELYPDDEE